ncbi:uncharacterized protein EDB91DRAFT_185665 [Suillus paluster]|uniref:uncharacterized protein n=1 Tax=Suillus paluster TaxID=48578 RepID=UPI001B886530|nr:uncharacterized protein EDB91DRAFT_185665 [Suillus paluster]KAG1723020.1 hypothetical protein EDB91DRAFT_185665 [Suillus paluster]
MEPVTRLTSVELPTELVLMILKYAATPTFSQAEKYDAKNPYASALALCRVSRDVRRAVLPELLHTVLLPENRHLTAFLHALRMQKEYAQQGHHLHFEYAPHVHRIWIENIQKQALQAHWPNSVSLMAPVLLGAESFATDLSSLFLLSGCLEHAWNSRKNIALECSQLPWRTRTLTFSHVTFLTPQRPLGFTPQGRAFLASISHVVSLSHPQAAHMHLLHRNVGLLGPGEHILPPWMMQTSWNSFTALATISLAVPHIELPVGASTFGAANMPVQLLTFPSSAFPRSRDHFSQDDVQVTISHTRIHYCSACQDWEKAWAFGLCD